MNKKGFTLIELLAVIIILGVITAIAVPAVTQLITRSKRDAALVSCKGYVSAIEKATLMLNVDGTRISAGNYDVSYFDSTIKIEGDKPTKGVVTVDSTGEVSTANLCINNILINYANKKATTDSSKCSTYVYKENTLNGATPVLGTGMIPVTIADDGTVKYADTTTAWYSYTNKKWANAVMLSSGTYTVGQTIPESAIRSYFVWIPKYSYKIWNYGTTTPTNTKFSINIKFGITNTSDSVSGECTTNVTGGNCSNGEYMTHPAFTTLGKNGIWVGKYETGYLGATTTATAQVSSSDQTKIIVKPNVYSWRGNTVYNMFLSSYNYNRINDSHMMKNTEWGAVAYLSNSEYGINKKININNNSSFKTGGSALTSTNQTIYPGTSGDGAAFNNSYKTETGYLASTTGNITGIYDMSGGAWEAVMGYVSGQLANSGFSTATATINDKYVDIYSASSTATSYSYRILGDATGEMGPFVSTTVGTWTGYRNSWYSDSSGFIDSVGPWFIRGNNYGEGNLAGQFSFHRFKGAADAFVSSRLVLEY